MNYKFKSITIKIRNHKPYKPSSLTELLCSTIEIKKNSIVADIGTGCGILAILASKLGAKRVYAIDIDKSCRKSIEANSKVNGAENITFVQGSMLKPLKEKVDAIIANLPQTPSNKKIIPQRYGSFDGAKYNAELIRCAPKYLKKNGTIFFSLMSISNPIKIFRLLKNKYKISIIAAKEREFARKSFDKLSKGLSDYIFELSKKNKAILHYRNGKWYFVSY
ncbi:50S ribosomal protein L11 methyltransferase, partial [Candidatus Woesearchaeota archaeon]|nr:50S ribosomal protein L11 methyltransferase [Candidatus Woesearchaeota archaeon]